MISVNDFKTGVTIEMDGQAWQVVEFQHVKPGKGAAFVRAKLKNVKTGSSVEKTFRAGEKLPKPAGDFRRSYRRGEKMAAGEYEHTGALFPGKYNWRGNTQLC